MDEKQKIESGFIIKNIILIESNFSRVNNVVFDNPKNNININVNVSVVNRIITVEETIDIVQKHGDNEQMKFHVKMVGIFEKIGESELNDLDKFGRINGASIIYPYIREHITNVTLKAGVGAVLLPPVNFTNQVVKNNPNNESN
jgi:preprotein translocase subunit SecB